MELLVSYAEWCIPAITFVLPVLPACLACPSNLHSLPSQSYETVAKTVRADDADPVY
jgi:hypothetical protein